MSAEIKLQHLMSHEWENKNLKSEWSKILLVNSELISILRPESPCFIPYSKMFDLLMDEILFTKVIKYLTPLCIITSLWSNRTRCNTQTLFYCCCLRWFGWVFLQFNSKFKNLQEFCDYFQIQWYKLSGAVCFKTIVLLMSSCVI